MSNKQTSYITDLSISIGMIPRQITKSMAHNWCLSCFLVWRNRVSFTDNIVSLKTVGPYLKTIHLILFKFVLIGQISGVTYNWILFRIQSKLSFCIPFQLPSKCYVFKVRQYISEAWVMFYFKRIKKTKIRQKNCYKSSMMFSLETGHSFVTLCTATKRCRLAAPFKLKTD